MAVVQSPGIDIHRCFFRLLPERIFLFCDVQAAEDEVGLDVEAAEVG